MLAAYEPTTLKDAELVWYKKYRNPDTHDLVTELRDLSRYTPEEVQEKVLYKHIERAVKREVKRALDLHGKTLPLNLDVEADDDQLTAHRVYDEYLRDCEGSEWDRLDMLLRHSRDCLYAIHYSALVDLVEGSRTLSDLNSRTREVLRNTVLQVLHIHA
jgi:adenylate kinase